MTTNEQPMRDMFDESEDSGVHKRFFEGDGFIWRKAEGSLCDVCDMPIEGRRFQVSHNVTQRWSHVSCVPRDRWLRWIGPPMGALPEAKKGPGPVTKGFVTGISKAIDAGTEVQLSLHLRDKLVKKGIDVSSIPEDVWT